MCGGVVVRVAVNGSEKEWAKGMDAVEVAGADGTSTKRNVNHRDFQPFICPCMTLCQHAARGFHTDQDCR